MKWRVAAAVALIVVGVGAIGIVIIGPSFGTSAPQYTTAQATATNVVSQVVGTGAIAPHGSYGMAFGVDPALAGSASGTGTGGSSTTWPVKTVNVTVGQKVPSASPSFPTVAVHE